MMMFNNNVGDMPVDQAQTVGLRRDVPPHRTLPALACQAGCDGYDPLNG